MRYPLPSGRSDDAKQKLLIDPPPSTLPPHAPLFETSTLEGGQAKPAVETEPVHSFKVSVRGKWAVPSPVERGGAVSAAVVLRWRLRGERRASLRRPGLIAPQKDPAC